MTAHPIPHPGYNGLLESVATLPSSAYFDPDHYQRELKAIWYRNWLYVGRASEITEPFSFMTFEVGDQNVLILRDEDGSLRAFHNTCRHRGSTLCREAKGKLSSKLLVCPYHRWSYDLKGNLRRAPSMLLPEGFDPTDYPLYDVAVRDWRGFIFVNLMGKHAAPFEQSFDRDSERVDAWPIESLIVGHTFTAAMKCNWKVFWENFNECLHCPNVHPELCELVPIYGRSIMTDKDDPSWQDHVASNDPRHKRGLRPGATTWSRDGKAHGPEFDVLSESERRAGMTYVTSLPSCFLVGHVDYMRLVRLRPLGPELTELRAEWLFTPEMLAAPGFDLKNITDFATLVMQQDADACELNQMGLRSIRHEQGVLMPEEYALKGFHDWVRDAMSGG